MEVCYEIIMLRKFVYTCNSKTYFLFLLTHPTPPIFGQILVYIVNLYFSHNIFLCVFIRSIFLFLLEIDTSFLNKHILQHKFLNFLQFFILPLVKSDEVVEILEILSDFNLLFLFWNLNFKL